MVGRMEGGRLEWVISRGRRRKRRGDDNDGGEGGECDISAQLIKELLRSVGDIDLF